MSTRLWFGSLWGDLRSALLAAITVTALTFSIMVVALVLASQQFSPRILRKFMSDPVKQNLIGFFLGTFVYTLLVLNRIDDASDPPFVPVVSVAFSLRMIEMAQIVQENERQQVLWRHAGMIARGVDRGIREPYDRQTIHQHRKSSWRKRTNNPLIDRGLLCAGG